MALLPVLVAAPTRDPFTSELVRFLRSNGCEVIPSEDSEGALRIARDRGPAAIVLDTMLQHGDGLSLCRQLRADPATARIPIFFYSVLMARDRCLEAGADGFMLKPVEQALLLERMRQAVKVQPVRRLPHQP